MSQILLSKLLESLNYDLQAIGQVPCADSQLISSLAFDSREVQPGSAFFAIPGIKNDGAEFIKEALANGAVAVISQSENQIVNKNFFYIQVDDVRAVLAEASQRFYDSPSDSLFLCGVTGTNGKSSVSWLMRNALENLGVQCSLYGTLNEKSITKISPPTTPDSLFLAKSLRQDINRKAKAAVLEVTSHALNQSRTAALNWDMAIFMNLGRDHLDYHKNIESYRSAKRKLFFKELLQSTKSDRHAIINIDDETGRGIAKDLKETCSDIYSTTFSLDKHSQADVYVTNFEANLKRTLIDVVVNGQSASIYSPLVGRFNISNIIAAVAALSAKGFGLSQIEDAIKDVPSVPGRMERVSSGEVNVFVDYAHSPDALISAQGALRELTTGRLITVFGCGGERDSGKRPLMGKAVAELSDVAVVTSDNPRGEEPRVIIDQILPGFDCADSSDFEFFVEVDRTEAIKLALSEAQPGDTVLIAGKGHESYQEVRGEFIEFSDKRACAEVLKETLFT